MAGIPERACLMHCCLQQGVPIVQVKYGSFGESVDYLHQYILQCITTAMDWMQGTEQQAE
jgi:hypothetical protein